MSATVRQLLDEDQNKVYPVGTAAAIYMHDGLYTVQNAWDDLQDGNESIKFPSASEIKKTKASGRIVDTIFNSDGTIVETTTEADGTLLQTKTTTFNDDGSIDITIT